MGLICDSPCWLSEYLRVSFPCCSMDIWSGPTQAPTHSAGKNLLAALLLSELAQHCKACTLGGALMVF